MKTLQKITDRFTYSLLVVMCLTLGLAPYTPPHFYQKLVMLINGSLQRPIDWFDLLMHGSPWLLLLSKGFVSIRQAIKNEIS